jgi:hypothetical protein
MGEYDFNQPLAEAPAAIRIKDKDVREPGKSGMVCYDSSKTDLLTAFVETEVKRVFDGTLYSLDPSTLGPI